MDGETTEVVAMTISEFVTDIGTVVTGAISWIGDYVEVITEQPLLLFFIALPVVGLGIGLIKRMLSL